jgi:aromatic ring-opening dioxygenase catalytic subunit (LigB family)
MTRTPTQPSLFIPHGGGPCFFMEWNMGPRDTWKSMEAWLRSLGDTLPARPRAIVVISGHWEEQAFTVTGAARPPLIYDYYGFPEHTYRLHYPAPGEPALAAQIVSLLNREGLSARADPARGFDHGVFIPFMLIFPDADIPIVQLSLHHSLDPELHYRAGQALASLRAEGVLITGSGMSYHNMQGFGAAGRQASELFDGWLFDALCGPAAGMNALCGWDQAPAARAAHPREEHLIPLMVAAGAGEGAAERIYSDHVLGVAVSAFRFGGS